MMPVNTCADNSWCQESSSFFDLGGGISVCTYSLAVSDCTPYLEIIFIKKGKLLYLEWHCSVFSFRIFSNIIGVV